MPFDREKVNEELLEIVSAAPDDMARFGLTRATVSRTTWLGSGSNGRAFLLPDGKHVLKRTMDQDEGGLALRLLQEGPIGGLPEVFYVGKIRMPRKKRPFDYLIVMEAARKPTGKRAADLGEMLDGSEAVDDEHPFVRDITSAVRFITRDVSTTPSDALYIAADEMDVHRDNLGIVKRDGRDMMIIVDLGQHQTMEHVDVPLAKNAAPLVVYTGTRVWEGRPEIRESRKGRVEHGPGLYFTTSLQTARKYAKGRGTVLRVEIDPTFVWLEDATAPIEDLVEWVAGRRGLRKKLEITDDLLTRAGRGRGLAPGMGRVATLVNLMVNYEAITGSHGPALAEFLASLGIAASHTRMSGNEDWVVLFDPSKILSWRHVEPGDTEMLPSVRQRS